MSLLLKSFQVSLNSNVVADKNRMTLVNNKWKRAKTSGIHRKLSQYEHDPSKVKIESMSENHEEWFIYSVGGEFVLSNVIILQVYCL